jgi:phosphate transport system protein
MARGFLAQEIKALKTELTQMSEYVERQVKSAIEALKALDNGLAEDVVTMDEVIDHQRIDIESHCLKLIATQQPVAKDLRVIMATFSIASDLERIGDHAEDIASIVCQHAREQLLKPLIDIPRMTDVAMGMLRDALKSLVEEDAHLARELCKRDAIVDGLYNQVFRELLVFMMADPKTIARATYLLITAQHIERIADLATNIAERSLYITTGLYEELNAN